MIRYCRLRLAVLLWSDTGALRATLSLTYLSNRTCIVGVAFSKKEIGFIKAVSACLLTLVWRIGMQFLLGAELLETADTTGITVSQSCLHWLCVICFISPESCCRSPEDRCLLLHSQMCTVCLASAVHDGVFSSGRKQIPATEFLPGHLQGFVGSVWRQCHN